MKLKESSSKTIKIKWCNSKDHDEKLVIGFSSWRKYDVSKEEFNRRLEEALLNNGKNTNHEKIMELLGVESSHTSRK